MLDVRPSEKRWELRALCRFCVGDSLIRSDALIRLMYYKRFTRRIAAITINSMVEMIFIYTYLLYRDEEYYRFDEICTGKHSYFAEWRPAVANVNRKIYARNVTNEWHAQRQTNNHIFEMKLFDVWRLCAYWIWRFAYIDAADNSSIFSL